MQEQEDKRRTKVTFIVITVINSVTLLANVTSMTGKIPRKMNQNLSKRRMKMS